MDKKLTIVIPAYEPDSHLPELIDNLNNFFNDFNIIVVNDGSKNCDEIFNDVKQKKNVLVLNHEVNKGKGEALKTAFRYIKDNKMESVIVTADSDGQHKPLDIKRIYEFYLAHNGGLVLGSRKFENEVPARSRFGNDVSRGLMRMCLHRHLNDTQTGLRAFDSNLLDFMLNVKGSKFEYEMNMLSEAVRNNIRIRELKIETIYIDENKGSHFRPVRDFLKISNSICKYKITFLLTLVLDFVLFFVFSKALANLGEYAYIHASYISSVLSVGAYLVMNLTSILYGDGNILRHKKLPLISGLVLYVGLNVLIVYLFKLFLGNLLVDKIISLFIILVLDLVLNFFVLRKSKLYE